MRKLNIHRIIALFFALYLPIVMMGLPLYKHYCKGNLQKMQLVFQPESCHSDDSHVKESSCCSSEFSEFILEKTACCSSKTSCHSSEITSEENYLVSDYSNYQLSEKDCCNDKLEILKVDFSYVNESSFYKSIDFKFLYPIFFIIKTINLERFHKNYFPPHRNHFFLDGQSRIIAFQQFLC